MPKGPVRRETAPLLSREETERRRAIAANRRMKGGQPGTRSIPGADADGRPPNPERRPPVTMAAQAPPAPRPLASPPRTTDGGLSHPTAPPRLGGPMPGPPVPAPPLPPRASPTAPGAPPPRKKVKKGEALPERPQVGAGWPAPAPGWPTPPPGGSWVRPVQAPPQSKRRKSDPPPRPLPRVAGPTEAFPERPKVNAAPAASPTEPAKPPAQSLRAWMALSPGAPPAGGEAPPIPVWSPEAGMAVLRTAPPPAPAAPAVAPPAATPAPGAPDFWGSAPPEPAEAPAPDLPGPYGYAPPPVLHPAPAPPAALAPAPSVPEAPRAPARAPEPVYLPGWPVPESGDEAGPRPWEPFPDRIPAPPLPAPQAPAASAPAAPPSAPPAPVRDPGSVPDGSWTTPLPAPAWVWDPVPPSVAATAAAPASGVATEPRWLDPLPEPPAPPVPAPAPVEPGAAENPRLFIDWAAAPSPPALPSVTRVDPTPAPVSPWSAPGEVPAAAGVATPVPSRPASLPGGRPEPQGPIFREHAASVVWPPREAPGPPAQAGRGESQVEEPARRPPRAVTPRPLPADAPVVKGPPSLRRVRPLYVVAALSVLGALVAIGVNVHFNSAASGQAATNPTPSTARAVVPPQVVPSGIVGPTAIEYLTPVVAPGGSVTIKVGALPSATCALSLLGIHGESLNIPGAVPMSIDRTGTAQETVALDAGLAPGTYRLVVVCQPGSRSVGSLNVS